MRYSHIRRLDLGLLPTLQALVEERSVSRAAERMHLSQPAMSRAFDRLQEIFGDELLVRTRSGYEPTHRALRIYAEIERLLPRLDGLLRGDDFDPATATDTFRIGATDYAVSVLLPPVMARLTELAPRIAVDIQPVNDAIFRRLETNALDLVLWVNSAPSEFRTEVLFEDSLVCLIRRDHPIGGRRMTLERYLSYPHAMVTLAYQQGVIDQFLEDRGLRRDVQVKTPYFATAGWLIERSDLILTLPKRLAERLATISGTRMIKSPITVPEFRYIQVWHPRMDGDPAHQWLRQIFAEALPKT